MQNGGSVTNGIAPPETAAVPTKVIKRAASRQLSSHDQDIVRLVGQHMRSLGMHKTVDQLVQESGCRLEHPAAARFRDFVMSGDWVSAVDELTQSELADMLRGSSHADAMQKMKFLLLEQKYLELIEDGDIPKALLCLRNELTPLNYNTERVHELCSFMMCSNVEDLHSKADWPGKGTKSRQMLMEYISMQEFLPASAMLPPRRLETLLRQAVCHQIDKCPYHNMSNDGLYTSICMLEDHTCSKEQFPTSTLQVLSDHTDEVWFCLFSHNGKYLATGSRDETVIIWTVNMDTMRVEHKSTFVGHLFGVSFMAWSPDDVYLAACGPDDCPELWIWNVETGQQRLKMSHSRIDNLTSCAWFPNGERLAAAGTKGQFYVCDLDGNVLESWEGVRVQCLQCRQDSTNTIIAADTHHRIRSYNLDEMCSDTFLTEDHAIMSFSLDKTGTRALLNVSTQGVHMWDLTNKDMLRKYHGVQQGFYTIHSCFGGANQEFIASGSEDCNVYIWHVNREKPVAILKGHTRTVSCVTWNPTNPNMLASCSDDGTIRIWGPAPENQRNKPRSSLAHRLEDDWDTSTVSEASEEGYVPGSEDGAQTSPE